MAKGVLGKIFSLHDRNKLLENPRDGKTSLGLECLEALSPTDRTPFKCHIRLGWSRGIVTDGYMTLSSYSVFLITKGFCSDQVSCDNE